VLLRPGLRRHRGWERGQRIRDVLVATGAPPAALGVFVVYFVAIWLLALLTLTAIHGSPSHIGAHDYLTNHGTRNAGQPGYLSARRNPHAASRPSRALPCSTSCVPGRSARASRGGPAWLELQRAGQGGQGLVEVDGAFADGIGLAEVAALLMFGDDLGQARAVSCGMLPTAADPVM
jgi:hypothetical protein